MKELEAIKERVEAATPGPWKEDTKVRGDVVVWGPNGRFLMNLQAETHWIDYPDEKRSVAFDVDARDATFIAHARTDVPKLLAALEAVDELSKRVSQQAADKYNKARTLPLDERAVAAAAAVEFEVIATDLLVAITEALQ